jgi:hypothetical protein
MKETAEEWIKWDIHTTGVQEIRWNGNEWIDTKGYTLWHSGENLKKREKCFKFYSIKNVRSSIMGFEPVTEYQE